MTMVEKDNQNITTMVDHGLPLSVVSCQRIQTKDGCVGEQWLKKIIKITTLADHG